MKSKTNKNKRCITVSQLLVVTLVTASAPDLGERRCQFYSAGLYYICMYTEMRTSESVFITGISMRNIIATDSGYYYYYKFSKKIIRYYIVVPCLYMYLPPAVMSCSSFSFCLCPLYYIVVPCLYMYLPPAVMSCSSFSFCLCPLYYIVVPCLHTLTSSSHVLF